jgi:hypothetical protein
MDSRVTYYMSKATCKECQTTIMTQIDFMMARFIEVDA